MEWTSFRTAIAVKRLRAVIRANRYLAPLIVTGLCLLPSVDEATVYTGVDTLTVTENFDFSSSKRAVNYAVADLSLEQVQHGSTLTVYPGVFYASEGIRDMGEVSFDSTTVFSETLEPDSSRVVFDPPGTAAFWYAPVLEGHLYIVWTREGHFAKMLLERIVFWPEKYGEDAAPQYLYGDFIACVILRWAYQDDGSRSFPLATAVQEASWGDLKSAWK